MSRNFIRAGAVFLILGIVLGVVMHHQHSRALVAVHAHITLAGGILMLVFGLVYGQDQEANRSKLALWHFWLYTVSSTLLLAWATFESFRGRTFDDTGSHPASFMVGVLGLMFTGSLLLFLINVFSSRCNKSDYGAPAEDNSVCQDPPSE